jgi:thioredoxin-related protein
MVLVLKSLSMTHSEDFAIGYVDVMKDRQAELENEIKVTPTLIFQDKDGKELFRWEGRMSQDQIIAKWNELEVISSVSL